MRKEVDLNSCINRSFKNINSVGQKIPDGLGGISIQNCFDSFYIHPDGKIFFIEAKLIKKNYGSFNFNIVEDHQYKNLINIKKYTNHIREHIKPCIAICYYIPRKLNEIIFIDIEVLEHLKNNLDKFSILKKEMLILKDNNFFLSIKSKKIEMLKNKQKYFNVQDIKILFKNDWERIFNDKT